MLGNSCFQKMRELRLLVGLVNDDFTLHNAEEVNNIANQRKPVLRCLMSNELQKVLKRGS